MPQTTEEATTAIAEYSHTEAGLQELRARLQGVAYDVTTTAGMAVAVKDRAEVRKLRTGLEAMRVEIKAPALERCRLIDAEAKRITTALLELERPIDDQIKVEEARKEAEKEAKRMAEVQRRERNSAAIAAIRHRAALAQGKSASEITGAIVALVRDELGAVDPDFHTLAQIAKDETLTALRDMHQAAIDREAEDKRRKEEAEALAKERAELARLRAEQDARDKAAREQLLAEQRAADAARAEADRQARALRDAEEAKLREERAAIRKAQDEADAAARAARLEQERLAAEKRAAEIRAQQDKEDTARRERLAMEVADQKGRDAWSKLAAVCELIVAGAKLVEVKKEAVAALQAAGRL